jgi:hypothetical protein
LQHPATHRDDGPESGDSLGVVGMPAPWIDLHDRSISPAFAVSAGRVEIGGTEFNAAPSRATILPRATILRARLHLSVQGRAEKPRMISGLDWLVRLENSRAGVDEGRRVTRWKAMVQGVVEHLLFVATHTGILVGHICPPRNRDILAATRSYIGGARPRRALESALTKSSTKNTTSKILAMEAANPARPKKPRYPAIIARIRNVKAQLNMAKYLKPQEKNAELRGTFPRRFREVSPGTHLSTLTQPKIGGLFLQPRQFWPPVKSHHRRQCIPAPS